MKIDLTYLWNSLKAACFVFATFAFISGANAGVYGTGNLNITNGTFVYDSTGTSLIDPLVGTFGSGDTYYELVTGNFSYSNTLPPNNEYFNYSGWGSVDVNGGQQNGGQSFFNAINFGYTTFNDIITSSPDAMALSTLAGMILGSPTGSTTVNTSLGSYAFSWAYVVDSVSGTWSNGRFNLWSGVDYSGGGNPALLVFPANASFEAQLELKAVPEPGTLGILGLGLLMVGLRVRRKTV